MTMDLRSQLLRDEGMRRTMYRDSRGIATIGVGHNLSVPLSDAAITQILDDDIRAHTAELEARWPFIQTLPDSPRRAALLNMTFNLGVGGLLKFVQMLPAIEAGDWATAARAALASDWAKQVGDRALRIARQLEENEWV